MNKFFKKFSNKFVNMKKIKFPVLKLKMKFRALHYNYQS